MEDIKYWIWLSRIENVGSIKLQKLLDEFSTPDIIWKLSKEKLLEVNGIGEETVRKIAEMKMQDLNKHLMMLLMVMI